jgi:hypothetical protein
VATLGSCSNHLFAQNGGAEYAVVSAGYVNWGVIVLNRHAIIPLALNKEEQVWVTMPPSKLPDTGNTRKDLDATRPSELSMVDIATRSSLQ